AHHGGVGGRRILARRRNFVWEPGFRLDHRRRRDHETIALQRAVDLGKIGGLVTRRRLQHAIARQRSGDVDAGIIEAREPIGRALRRRSADWPAEAVSCELDGGGGASDALLPAFSDAGLPREQRGDVLIAGLVRHQAEDTKRNTEGREPRALRLLTLYWYQRTHATLHTQKARMQYIRAIR